MQDNSSLEDCYSSKSYNNYFHSHGLRYSFICDLAVSFNAPLKNLFRY